MAIVIAVVRVVSGLGEVCNKIKVEGFEEVEGIEECKGLIGEV